MMMMMIIDPVFANAAPAAATGPAAAVYMLYSIFTRLFSEATVAGDRFFLPLSAFDFLAQNHAAKECMEGGFKPSFNGFTEKNCFDWMRISQTSPSLKTVLITKTVAKCLTYLSVS
jgi:hypothetical protein